jgi:4-hydroxybenzoate polyprenyltransferase
MEFTGVYKDAKASAGHYIDLARTYNASAALLSFALGYFFYSPSVSWFNFFLGFIVVAILHSAFTMQNDLYDLDVDTANNRKTPLINGKITKNALQKVIFNLFLISIVIIWFSTLNLYGLAFVLVYTAVAWLYNSPKFSASRRPVVSIVLLGLLYTLLPLIFGLIVGGNSFTRMFLLFAAVITGIRVSISILKDFKDAKGDRKYNKRTFYLVFGRKPVIYISCALALICYPLVSLLLITHKRLSLILIGGIIVAAFLNAINRLTLLRALKEERLTRIFQKSFIFENYFEAIILVCLLRS